MRRRTSGVSLIELIIAIGIMSVALFGLISVITFTTRSNMATRENMLAMRGCEKKIEEMMSTVFSSIFSKYKVGSSPAEDTFDIPGLIPLPGNTKVGTVKFAVRSGSPDVLLETVTGTLMENLDATGAPVDLDLDGNGTIDTSDKSAVYKILPVVIEVKWLGVLGNRQMTYKHIFLQK